MKWTPYGIAGLIVGMASWVIATASFSGVVYGMLLGVAVVVPVSYAYGRMLDRMPSHTPGVCPRCDGIGSLSFGKVVKDCINCGGTGKLLVGRARPA
jgi:hypothetical protein